jgi:uncharacterized membrane protein
MKTAADYTLDRGFNYFRFNYALTCLLITGIVAPLLFNLSLNPTLIEHISLFKKCIWSILFAIGGFGLLVLKLWITQIYVKPPEKNGQIPNKKEESAEDKALHQNTLIEEEKLSLIQMKWRYFTYYPIMLIVLSLLSVAISLHLFELKKSPFLGSMALVSFFLGYFVDALPNIIEKIGGKFGGKE